MFDVVQKYLEVYILCGERRQERYIMKQKTYSYSNVSPKCCMPLLLVRYVHSMIYIRRDLGLGKYSRYWSNVKSQLLETTKL